jgi:hypothetical protein
MVMLVEGPAVDTCYVDAQGVPLTVQSTRLANVQFGDVTFKERFIVKDVTCPLLSLGSVLRGGCNIMHIDGTPYSVKDDMKISVMFRNNSLCSRSDFYGFSSGSTTCSAWCESLTVRHGASMFDPWMESYQSSPFCNQNCAASACQHNLVSQR